ncbi:unnamed protein product [Lactuca virosa]|uniref:DNA helicase Pif1-like 2B domain-containing protein n=1 Tax=Lactuca virosa TaxID=75947 RepID=A0AAU9N3G2_9ASTR|nr:unnamed protein product [Lactuca virosa]
MEINISQSDYIISRAILSTRNDSVDEINDLLIGRFHGEEKIYYSFDEAVDDINNFYPVEFLNTLSVSGLPPHYLRLKVGCPIILLRNLDPSNGLCNGTRLICKGFQHNVIDAEIAVAAIKPILIVSTKDAVISTNVSHRRSTAADFPHQRCNNIHRCFPLLSMLSFTLTIIFLLFPYLEQVISELISFSSFTLPLSTLT